MAKRSDANRKKNHQRHATESANMRTSRDKISAKRDAVLQNRSKKRLPLFVAAAIALLLAGGGFFYLQQKNTTVAVSAADGSPGFVKTRITYPVHLFDDGKARHFEYRDGAITVKYFIIKSADGVIRAAYDACDVCWPAGKGYSQSGDHMVCRNCGQRFASVLVNEVKGGCNPAPLQRRVEKGLVVLHAEDILDGKPYFNFSGKV